MDSLFPPVKKIALEWDIFLERGVKRSSKPGPRAETLAVDAPFEDAIQHALGKKRPAEGWPRPKAKPKAKKKQARKKPKR